MAAVDLPPETPMNAIQIISLTMGTAWASGINLYAAVFMLGFMGRNGYVALPAGLEMLTDPLVIGVAGLMYCIEFFADKAPGVDSAWDAVHTFIRIPAGAILAMQAVGPTDPALQLTAFLVGGSLAAGTHFTKAGTRALINTSPEPFSNWVASFSEDLLVIAGLWVALQHPWAFMVLLALFILLMVWLLPKLWQGMCALARRIRTLFRRPDNELPAPSRRDSLST